MVLAAAGMDTRAFRLNWPPGTRLYEMDLPEVLAAKDSVIEDAGARAQAASGGGRSAAGDLAAGAPPR